MTTWKLAVLVGAVTAASVSGVALALDGDDAGSRDRRAAAATMVAAQSYADGDRCGDGRGAMQELMGNEDFRDDLWALQEKQQTAIRAWWDEYGGDPTGDEARAALDELREAQRAAMQTLMEKYGVEWQKGDGNGSALQQLMADEEFRKELWALQDDIGAAVQSWWDEYGDDPTSDAAREALQKLRDDERAKLEALYEKYGVDVDDFAGRGRGGGLMGGGLFGGGLMGGGRMEGGPGGMGGGMGGGGMGPGAGQSGSSGDSTTSGTF